MIPKGKGLSRLGIFYKKSRTQKISNKFYSKALCYKAVFSQVKFYNINFKGAVFSNCSFKNASFLNVEFLGTNLKSSNFTGAIFKNCIFSATLLKKSNFKGAKFENCIFINTNFKVAKNLNIENSNNLYLNHNLPNLDSELISLFNKYRFHPKLHNYRVLHLKGGKLNSITINLLISNLGIEKCKKGLINLDKCLSSRVITSYELYKLIDKASNLSI